MNNKLRGTLTEQNLINAFAGESMANGRYVFYSKIAKDEGYEQISAIFKEIADNEREHSKLFLQHISKNPLGHVDGFYSFEFGTTEDNLNIAISGETEEYDTLYKEAEEVAEEEGFSSIAKTFKYVRNVEKHHAKRYKELLLTLEKGSIFNKKEVVEWICRKCGYVHEDNNAPKVCPNCSHPQGYFQILYEKY